MKSFTKTLFVLTVFFGVLSTYSNNCKARGRILQQHNISDDESKLPLPFPNPFGGGFTFPGAGSTGEWFPGQGGGSNNPGAGSTGDWFPGQGGGSNIPGPHHFCSLPGIKCATAHQDEVIPADNNNNYKKNVIGTMVDDGRVIGGSP